VATGDESQHIVVQRCDSKSRAASDNQNSNVRWRAYCQEGILLQINWKSGTLGTGNL